jgi:hypothetical protein
MRKGKPARGALTVLAEISRRCVDRVGRGRIVALGLRCGTFLRRRRTTTVGRFTSKLRQHSFHEGAAGGWPLCRGQNVVLSRISLSIVLDSPVSNHAQPRSIHRRNRVKPTRKNDRLSPFPSLGGPLRSYLHHRPISVPSSSTFF